jgi:hypothetical protein
MNIYNPNQSSQILQIQVYDNFSIDYNKYPRKDTGKYETDIAMIQFLMNQEYLEKVALSYSTAIQFFNECKEYYFLLKSLDGKQNKRFSAKEIMFIMNQINMYANKNPDVYSIQKYLRNFHPLDQLYYILIKNKEFYLQLFHNVKDAKYAFFERREINYKFFIPFDFYGDIKTTNLNRGQVYTAIELLEINAYTQFLVKNKIIKNLPNPLFIRNYFDIEPFVKKTDNKNKSLNQNIKIKEKDENKEKNKSIFIEKTKTIENDFLMDLQRIILESEDNLKEKEKEKEEEEEEFFNKFYGNENQEYEINNSLDENENENENNIQNKIIKTNQKEKNKKYHKTKIKEEKKRESKDFKINKNNEYFENENYNIKFLKNNEENENQTQNQNNNIKTIYFS